MLDRRDRRQRVVVDLDSVAAVLGGVPRLGDDDRDRVARDPDAVGREHGEHGAQVPRGLRDALEAREGEVVRRQHGDDAGHLPRLGRVDAVDRGVRERAAHEGGLQHPRQRDVRRGSGRGR